MKKHDVIIQQAPNPNPANRQNITAARSDGANSHLNITTASSNGICYFIAVLGTLACGLIPVVLVASRSIANGIPTRRKHVKNEDRFKQPAHKFATSKSIAWIGSVAAIAVGACSIGVILFLLAFVEVWLFPNANLALGINPFDLFFGPDSYLTGEDGPLSKWVNRDQSGIPLANANIIGIFISKQVSNMLNFIGAGPGYISDHGEFAGYILPGHSQLILLSCFWTLVYGSWYVGSMFDYSWKISNWPSLFYALILLFFFAWLMPGAAFFFDRYGIPPSLAIGTGLALGALFCRTDHYFKLISGKPIKRPLEATPSTDEVSPKNEAYPNSFVKAANLSDQELTRPYWMDAVKRLDLPEDKNGERTLVVVTASGGGIQAAAWAGKVLSELDHQYEGFADSIGLISGVSGGSVGVMQYLAHRGYRLTKNEKEILGDSLADLQMAASDRAYHQSRRSSLEAVAWGIVFPDFIRAILNPLAARFQDRGWALEANWWNQLGTKNDDRTIVKRVRLSDFTRLVNAGRLPPVVFNSTIVQTGQRVLFSTIRQDSAAAPSTETAETLAKPDDFFQLGNEISEPVDFEQYLAQTYRELSDSTGTQLIDETDIPLTTAVRLSSTFAYVAPVTKPYSVKLNATQKNFRRKKAMQLAKAKLNQHFADGGYADNTGTVTVVKLLRSLLDLYRSPNQPLPKIDRIHLVRIEPFPPSRQVLQTKENGVGVSLFGPSTALDRARVATQAERADLEVDLLLQAFEKAQQEYNHTPVLSQQVIQYQSGDNEQKEIPFEPELNEVDDLANQKPSRTQKRAMPPLSWRLTPNNIRAIEQDWQTQKSMALDHLNTIFEPRKKN